MTMVYGPNFKVRPVLKECLLLIEAPQLAAVRKHRLGRATRPCKSISGSKRLWIKGHLGPSGPSWEDAVEIRMV